MRKIIYTLLLISIFVGITKVNATTTDSLPPELPPVPIYTPRLLASDPNTQDVEVYSGRNFRVERGMVVAINKDDNSIEYRKGLMPKCKAPLINRPYVSTTSVLNIKAGCDTPKKDIVKVDIDNVLVLDKNDHVIYSLKEMEIPGGVALKIGQPLIVIYKGRDIKPYMLKVSPLIMNYEGSYDKEPGGGKIEIMKEQDKMNKEDIKKLQMLLKEGGYFPAKVPETGIFGSTTRQAVMDFQRRMGITATGYVGTRTLESLNSN